VKREKKGKGERFKWRSEPQSLIVEFHILYFKYQIYYFTWFKFQIPDASPKALLPIQDIEGA
jgi:hypothetical protein